MGIQTRLECVGFLLAAMWSLLRTIWQHRWIRLATSAIGMLGLYDLASSQIAWWSLPKFWQAIAWAARLSGPLLPWWGWTAILVVVLVLGCFETAFRSAREVVGKGNNSATMGAVILMVAGACAFVTLFGAGVIWFVVAQETTYSAPTTPSVPPLTSKQRTAIGGIIDILTPSAATSVTKEENIPRVVSEGINITDHWQEYIERNDLAQFEISIDKFNDLQRTVSNRVDDIRHDLPDDLYDATDQGKHYWPGLQAAINNLRSAVHDLRIGAPAPRGAQHDRLTPFVNNLHQAVLGTDGWAQNTRRILLARGRGRDGP